MNIQELREKHAEKAYTKPRLKEQFGLRPKRGQRPEGEFENRFGTTCYTYKVSDCVPIKQRVAPSEKQLENQKRFAEISRAKSALKEHAWAGELDSDTLLVELATTDLDPAKICEFWLCDLDGNLLMHELCNPEHPVSPGALDQHGHTNEELSKHSKLSEVWPKFVALIKGKKLAAWSTFDAYAMREHEDIQHWDSYTDLQWQEVDDEYGTALYSVTKYESACAKGKGEALLKLVQKARQEYFEAKKRLDEIGE